LPASGDERRESRTEARSEEPRASESRPAEAKSQESRPPESSGYHSNQSFHFEPTRAPTEPSKTYTVWSSTPSGSGGGRDE
jgi:hypothetical protein